MAGKAKEAGPSSQRVAANLRHIRRERELTTAALSRRLAELGHPIADTGITKIEKGDRRVDVDDLVALAVALDATPNRLLLPEMDAGHPSAKFDLTPRGTQQRLDDAWAWASGERQLSRAPGPARDGWLPPLGAETIERARPHADAIWQRLRELALQGIAEPAGGQLFPADPVDAQTWDLRADVLTTEERVWLVAALRARHGATAAEEERSAYGASA